MFSSDKRHPCRPVGINDREIEHIDNFTIEQSRITAAIRHETGYLLMCTFVEDDSIEYTVDDITQCTG